MTEEVKKKKSDIGIILALRWFIFIAFIVFMASVIGRTVSKAFFTRHIVIEVTDKGIKDNKYMVYGRTVTDDHLPKSYEISDSVLANRYDSSDLYGAIEVGKTYEMIVGGNRVPFMSWYPDIYEVVPVHVDESKPLTEETETEVR